MTFRQDGYAYESSSVRKIHCTGSTFQQMNILKHW